MSALILEQITACILDNCVYLVFMSATASKAMKRPYQIINVVYIYQYKNFEYFSSTQIY